MKFLSFVFWAGFVSSSVVFSAEGYPLWNRISNTNRLIPENLREERDRAKRNQKRVEFLLKEFQDLKATDLIEASRQACKAMREQHSNIDDDMKYVSLMYWLCSCLEFYPEKAELESGLENLLSVVKNKREDIFFRRFLLQMVTPQNFNFSIYLSKNLLQDRIQTYNFLRLIFLDETEFVEVRCGAIKASVTILREAYLKVFNQDSNINEYGRKTGNVIFPNNVLEGKVSLEKKTVADLKPIDESYIALLGDLSILLENENGNFEVKNAARRCLELIPNVCISMSVNEKVNVLKDKFERRKE